MPFCLCNTGQTFQYLMYGILQGLPFVFMYIDNIIVASGAQREHLDHLETVFHCLQDHRLIICPDECQFGDSLPRTFHPPLPSTIW